MAKNPQWHMTLDAYHRFVVDQFQGILGSSRSEVIQSMLRSWVSDHPDQVEQAGASIASWRERGNTEGD